MAMLSDDEAFELWEGCGIELYYALRDIEMYVECLQMINEKMKKLIEKKKGVKFDAQALKTVESRVSEKFDEVRRSFDQIESFLSQMKENK